MSIAVPSRTLRNTPLMRVVCNPNSGIKIVGGGDTVAVVEKYDIADSISYISTGGGAFLEFLKNRTLPSVEVLKNRNKA